MPNRSPARHHPLILLAAMLAGLGALSGCSREGTDYPSLASRPVERLTDAPAPASPGPAPAAVLSPDLAGRLDKLLEQARAAKRDFDDKQAAAERAIAAAGSAPVGSEAWALATQALSGVQSARSQTAQPLSDLDRLDVEDQLRGAQLSSTQDVVRPDTVAIAQAREAVAALVAQEDAVLGRLDGRLAR